MYSTWKIFLCVKMDLESTSNEATKLHYELFSLITWFPRKFIWIKTLLNIVIEV